ncbi:MAG: glycosyltransferase family 1 protein [Magnetococcales bacterium]|nr:glycosyltransferase family 1 protein [Magnetococcales bacterium]
MRILLIIDGLYELFFSLQGELLALGHEVYVLHLDPTYLKKAEGYAIEPLSGEVCDLVFTANIFTSEGKHSVMSLLARYQINCPIVNITLSHPVNEIEKLLHRFDKKKCNEIINDLKIIFWSPCEKATEEYRRLGFESIVSASLGLSSKNYTLPFLRWNKPETASKKMFHDNLTTSKKLGDRDFSNAEIIYMGVLPGKPDNLEPEVDLLARSMVDISVADPTISRMDMEPFWSYIMSKDPVKQPEIWFILVNAYLYYHARATRRVFVHRLKKEFGKRFLLIGDDWIKDNLDADPTENILSRGQLYHNIPVSVDFGSLSLDTCFFPRPIEIVKNRGCLLSYRRYDSEHYFQENADSLVFDNPDEMCEKVEILLNSKETRDQCRDNIFNTFTQKHGMRDSIVKVITKALSNTF